MNLVDEGGKENQVFIKNKEEERERKRMTLTNSNSECKAQRLNSLITG